MYDVTSIIRCDMFTSRSGSGKIKALKLTIGCYSSRYVDPGYMYVQLRI
jgi:hypothetical protein